MPTHERFSGLYLQYLEAMGRHSTAQHVALVLHGYVMALEARGVDPATATTADIESWLPSLSNLATSTRAARIHTVRGFHQWLQRRGHRSDDPSAPIKPPKVSRRTVAKDYLTQQEAMALLETADELVAETNDPRRRALAHRNLAMVALALATGRRRSGVCGLMLSSLDLERRELRVEIEKGRPGRVLPVAEWACDIVGAYIRDARAVVLGRRHRSGVLYPGERGAMVSHSSYARMLRGLHHETCRRNPDLQELPDKRITTHSLRVTFAQVLFQGGCNLRSLNELMLHQKLSTTAHYTPVPVEALRRVLVDAHPRAKE